ncbi:hypothetical protein GIB67_005637 [Kingdonia uniflora]|uniref:Uncharacterized protein n=1 Tax=Kingdonia uniflora TaxID=39325 RepID=A0A7J7NHN7_9MAGN|nr:hypothetical protein GIB67_005637 [Kingdonia uniflora]
MEEKLSTPELNIALKLAWLNEILDGPVDMATVSSTVVRNLAKRKAIKRGDAPRSVLSISVDDSSKRRKVISPTKSQEVLEESDKRFEGTDLRPRFEVKADLLEEQCRAKAREKMILSMGLKKRISQLEGEKNQLEVNLTRERVDSQLEREKEREADGLKLKEVRAESEAEVERLVTASAISRNNHAGKLNQLRYTKAEITAFSEGNYVEMEIMDEEEVEEREDGLNVAEKTAADNQVTINQEIENSCLRVVDLEGLLEVEKKSSAVLQLSLKLEEAKRQVEEKTAAILSRDLALNQLTSELTELKGKATSGSRHEAELAEYHIRALNEEISDMKCNIRTLNEQLLKKSIDLTRQISERIYQLTAELAESKARRLKDNKRAAVTHQAFKELVVHEQEKCDGEALHQRQLSVLVTFFVEEIKFLQVERDLMQDCFSGRTCVCKLDISSIDPIGVMDRGIETTMAEQITRGREIFAERAPEYLPSRTEIGENSSVVSPPPIVGVRSSVVSPTPIVGGRSTALPSRKSSRVKNKLN